MTTISVIGAGAIGGYYGSKLAAAGHDVHFLFRTDAAYVAAHGLTVHSVDGDYRIRDVATHSTIDSMPASDVVLVAVKSDANDAVAPSVAALVKPGGVILLIQNGLGGEPVFAAAAPQAQVIGGLAFINSERTGRNEVTHSGNGGLTIAAYLDDYRPAGLTPGMQVVATAYETTTVPVTSQPDLMWARWSKSLWNIPYNSLSVVLRANTAEMMNSPSGEALVRTIMLEVLAAAAADGREIGNDQMELMLAVTRDMDPYDTSMKVDFDRGRHIEVEAVVGEPLRRGLRLGVPMPTIEAIYRELCFINDRILIS